MRVKKILKISLIVGLIVLIFFLCSILIFITQAISSVKDIDVSLNLSTQSACKFYDIDENLIDTNININHVKLDSISNDTKNAFISIEDKEFYSHNGLNFRRIVGAFISNIKQGKFAEGASTITQQLVKNKFLTNEKNISRKIKEAYLAKKIEFMESKEEILESYLNTIYFGHGAYGIGNASLKYFNKSVNELTLSESCLLAGLIKSPMIYSPINSNEASIRRRNIVLKEMLEDNLITKEEYVNAIEEEIVINEQKTNIDTDNLYVRNVLLEASQILGMNENEILQRGYKIYTYQDRYIQLILNETINNEKYYPKNSYGNIADSLSIIIDNSTAGVKAISGKSKYDLLNFKRQPGSLIKPILVYAPAIEEGLVYPCSEILDEKISIDGYSPQNVSDKYYGYVSIKDAVAKSLNTPAVKLCNKLGVDVCKCYANKCGLDFDDNDNGLAISLGGLTNGYTLQDITDSYLSFTNNGQYRKSCFIKEIKTITNNAIYINNMAETNYVSQDTAFLMTECMRYSVKNGTSKKLSNLGYDIAGKTGTVNVKNTNLNTDAYSLAYTSDLTMSTWFGNYSMNKENHLDGNNNGGTYATEIIRDVFDKIYVDASPTDFIQPDSIVSLPIDVISLNKNHEILIGDSLPKRFTQNEIFSTSNIPPSTSILDNIEISNFNIITNSDSIYIEFDAEPYLTYYLYRKTKEKIDLLATIRNENGLYVYRDNSIKYNTEYEYYIVSKNFNGKKLQSKTLATSISKDYNQIINREDNISFIFQ